MFKKDSKISHLFSGGGAGYLATFLLTKCWHGRAAMARGLHARPRRPPGKPHVHARVRSAAPRSCDPEGADGSCPVMCQRLQLPPCPRDLLCPPPLEPRSCPAQCLSPEDCPARF